MNKNKKLLVIVVVVLLTVTMAACDSLPSHFGVGTCSKWNSCPNGYNTDNPLGLVLIVILGIVLTLGSKRSNRRIAGVLFLALAAMVALAGCAGGDPSSTALLGGM